MNKKFISAIMAGAMAISALGMSAFAADLVPNTQEDAAYAGKAQSYKIAAAVTSPEMKVTLPSTANAIINPYGIAAKINEESVGKNGIISPIYTITNNSTELGIQVTAKTSATPGEGITMKDTALAASTTEATAFKSSSTEKEAFAQVMVAAKLADPLAATGTPAVFKTYAEGAEVPSTKLFHLKAASESGGTVTPEKGYFQIQGEVSRFDKDEKELVWSKEKINLVLVIDVTPSTTTASAKD